MNIAVISAHSCPAGTLGTKDTGGMSVYTLEIARELGKLGHKVDVYTRLHNPDDLVVLELGENARLIHIEAGERTKLHKLAVHGLLPEFTANLEMFRKENNLEYDIVYTHYWISTLAGEEFSRLWQVPHVTMFHTLGAMKNTFGVGEPDPDLRIDTEGELVKSVHRIIAPTEREKGELVNRYNADPNKIGVVPCGVNMELFRPLDRAESRQRIGLVNGKIILFAGRIDPLKGIANLVKAVALIKGGKDTRLVIVGGGNGDNEVQTYRELARDCGIAENVTFTGAVSQDTMPYYYTAADVCVLPSYYESFGLVALEALSCGMPVVANDVGDLKNIIRQGETGFVTAGNSPAVLAETIGQALDSRFAPAETIRESVKQYTWADVAGALTGEFERLICRYRVPVS
ncbi:MAG: glycosyltransferase family 1 protein [Dehalococcoidales bacterium]|nr:glycosyltransferase family 1 protein [Dehalococcoidales bacterium]